MLNRYEEEYEFSLVLKFQLERLHKLIWSVENGKRHPGLPKKLWDWMQPDFGNMPMMRKYVVKKQIEDEKWLQNVLELDKAAAESIAEEKELRLLGDMLDIPKS